MREKENIVTLASVLFIITALVALLLASVNMLTIKKIEENGQKEQAEARMSVLQEADAFDEVSYQAIEGSSVKRIFEGKKDGQTVGYCVNVTPNGFGGAIDMMVGIKTDGIVEAVKIVSMSETPGLGSKASDSAFIDQFAGKKGQSPISVIKSGVAKNDEIVAIAGATITSRGVTEGVNEAIAAINGLKGGAS